MLEESLRIGTCLSKILNTQAVEDLGFSLTWNQRVMKIGITGSSGAGKSSLINQLAKRLLALGYSIAILLIDPSSRLTGGSLLADRTRLDPNLLSQGVFIRSMSSGNSPDGLPERLSLVLHFLENEIFDVILIETIGVGQDSTSIRDFSDILITLPSNDIGDIMQYFKMGSFEVADYIFFNKSDLNEHGKSSRNENLVTEFLSTKDWGDARPPQPFFGNTVTNNGMEDLLHNLEEDLREKIRNAE